MVSAIDFCVLALDGNCTPRGCYAALSHLTKRTRKRYAACFSLLVFVGAVLLITGSCLKEERDRAIHEVWDTHDCDEKTSKWHLSYQDDGTVEPIPHPEYEHYCNCRHSNRRSNPADSPDYCGGIWCGRRLVEETDPFHVVTSGSACTTSGGNGYGLCEATGIHYCCGVCTGMHLCTSQGGLEGCACRPPEPPLPPSAPAPPSYPPFPPSAPPALPPIGDFSVPVTMADAGGWECFLLGLQGPPLCQFHNDCSSTLGNCTGCYRLDNAWRTGTDVR